MPRVLGDEYRSALLKMVAHIVQYENSTALQNVEGLVHVKVSMDRNASPDCHLLGPQGELVRACCRANLDEDVSVVAKMNEMLARIAAEHISLRVRIDFSKRSNYSGCACCLQKAATAL